jgi:hypothetical protein
VPLSPQPKLTSEVTDRIMTQRERLAVCMREGCLMSVRNARAVRRANAPIGLDMGLDDPGYHHRVLALWLGSLVSFTNPTHPGLVVHADPCLELDVVVLHDSIEFQLGAGPDYRGDAAGLATDTQLLLDCSDDGRAELTVIDPLTNTSATQVLELPTTRRSERLGWAGAALLRSVWMNLAIDADPIENSPAARRAARVARRPVTAWELGDGFAVRGFFDPRSPRLLLAEQVEAVHRPLRHLAWKADGEIAAFSFPVEDDGQSDRVKIRSVSVAPSLLGWGEIPARGRNGAGTVAIYGGAGLRIGGVRMLSEQLGESKGFDLFAGPLTTARISVSLSRFVRLAVNAEAGWILHGPVRPGGVPMSFVGPWANGVLVLVSAF